MNPRASAAVRLAHFSDIHLTAPACAWRLRDWFNKRMSAWVNLRLLGRAKQFRQSEKILAALTAELRQGHFDHIVFSGDATAMGFAEEARKAAELLGLGQPEAQASMPPGLAVPGNHDYCTRDAMTSGCFERYFAPWQEGERIGTEVYPFAQRVGPIWLVAVNSATVNRWAWDARGRVGAAQLGRLAKLLDRLQPGPRVLVTHYPVCLANGQPEHHGHGLRDLDELLRVAKDGGVVLWLHGHRHDAYHHPCGRAPFPIVCAGSATQHGRWSYSDCTLSGQRLRVAQRVYDAEHERFREGRTFEVELPRPIAD